MTRSTGRPRSRRTLAVLIAAVCGLFALPGSALASTVTFSDGSTDDGASASYSSDAGGDTLAVTTSATAITFTSSQTITSGDPGCSASATTVTCTAVSGDVLGSWSAETSEAADAVTINGPVAGSVSTRGGNDAILGSDVNAPVFSPATGQLLDNGVEFLDGGSGTDGIQARGGNDNAIGGRVLAEADSGDQVDLGAGNDSSQIEGADDGVGDALQGGPGVDSIAVSGSTSPTSTATPFDAFAANLATGAFAKLNNTPESDTVAGFEDYSANGATGGNTVAGTPTSNIVSTDDRADAVNPGAGGDQLDLFAGNDSADTRDGFADRVNCGVGTDGAAVDQFDEVVDCESVTVSKVRPAGADLVAPTCKITRMKGRYTRRAFFKGFTPKFTCSEPTTVTAQLLVSVKRSGKLVTGAKAGDLVLAERTYKLAAGTRGLKVKPSRRLGKNLPKRFKASYRITAQDEFGNRRAVTKRTAVKAKAKKKSRKRRSRRR